MSLQNKDWKNIINDVENIKHYIEKGEKEIYKNLYDLLSININNKDCWESYKEILQQLNNIKKNNPKEYLTYLKILKKTRQEEKNIEKRKKWTENFQNFADKLENILFEIDDGYNAEDIEKTKKINRQIITSNITTRKYIAWIQSMFLWEKPVLDLNFSKTTEKQIQEICTLFKEFWFIANVYPNQSIILYNKNLVKKVLTKHKKYFNQDNTEEIINSNIRKLSDIELWLLFGYPLESCIWYTNNEKHEDKQKTIDQARLYLKNEENDNEYWFTFVRYNVWDETKMFMEKIKNAFHKSWILEKWDTLKNKI